MKVNLKEMQSEQVALKKEINAIDVELFGKFDKQRLQLNEELSKKLSDVDWKISVAKSLKNCDVKRFNDDMLKYKLEMSAIKREYSEKLDAVEVAFNKQRNDTIFDPKMIQHREYEKQLSDINTKLKYYERDLEDSKNMEKAEDNRNQIRYLRSIQKNKGGSL